MKPSDFLNDIGRTVAYYPKIALALGNVKQGLLLCQLIYWSDKGSKGDGWIYKSQEEMQCETGLSYDEQRTARKALVQIGVLEEHYARLEHHLYFRVNLEVLQMVWSVSQHFKQPFPQIEKTDFGRSEIKRCRKAIAQFCEKGGAQIDVLTQNTSEMTAEMTAADATTTTRVSNGVTVSSGSSGFPEEVEQSKSEVGTVPNVSREQEKNEVGRWLEVEDWFEEE